MRPAEAGEAAQARRVLVVDDAPENRALLVRQLSRFGYRAEQAAGGFEALKRAHADPPDLILLDVMMPDLSGFEVCRLLRADARFEMTPIVLVTALDAASDRVRGLEAGADDFLSKPYDADELWARVRSLLRVKTLYDQVVAQRQQLAEWSATLEQRVQDQLGELERLARLKRFFSPALAARLLLDGEANPMRSHRREISVLFADLRGFTAFADAVPNEDLVMQVLAEFHAAAGKAIHAHEGTLERFTGDGFMVFFNDPEPQADHAARALALARELQAHGAQLDAQWRERGVKLGLGLGLSCGVATLGAIGFDARQDYAAIGTVTNRAARLCARAQAGQLLVCDRLWKRLPADAASVQADGPFGLVLPGLADEVQAYSISTPGATVAGADSPLGRVPAA